MNYSTKNLIKAILTCILLSTGFYFFFGMKLLLVSILIGAFLSVSMFFNPSKLQKEKRDEENRKNLEVTSQELDPKEISQDDIKNLGLDNIDIDEDSDK